MSDGRGFLVYLGSCVIIWAVSAVWMGKRGHLTNTAETPGGILFFTLILSFVWPFVLCIVLVVFSFKTLGGALAALHHTKPEDDIMRDAEKEVEEELKR